MPRLKKKNNNKKSNRKTKAEEKQSFPSIVGPDLFLLLQGRLFDDTDANTNSSHSNSNSNSKRGTTSGNSSIIGGGKNVSLILCGESHNDAVDVTRRSPPGKFGPTEGWIPVFDSLQSDDENDIYTALPRALFVSSRRESTQQSSVSASSSASQQQQQQLSSLRPSIENLALRYLHPVNGNKNKPVTLGRAKELASAFVEKYEIEEDMFGRNLLMLWVATNDPSSRTEKGEAFLLEVESEDQVENNMDDDEDNVETDLEDEEEAYDDWVFFTSDTALYDDPLQQRNRLGLPSLVAQWMDDVMMVMHEDYSTAATIDDAIDDMNDDGNENENENNPVHGEENIIMDGISENENATLPSMRSRLMQRRLGRFVLFEFGDLDSVAYNLLKRRLGMTDTELTSNEYDEIIETRKRVLKEENNVWTFDDWFDHVKAGDAKTGEGVGVNGNPLKSNTNGTAGTNHPSVHLVLEASVPPWEVELHRPRLKEETTEEGASVSTNTTEAEEFRLHPAAECVRCLSEDSEGPWEDEYDPRHDGIGSYVDFVYRKMMVATTKKTAAKHEQEEVDGPSEDEAVVSEEKTTEEDRHSTGDGDDTASNMIANQTSHCNKHENCETNWLHCIDVRDLGCEAACHAESVKQQWYDLLSQDEQEVLSNPKDVKKDACPVNDEGDAMRFLPAYKLNPEWIELERLRSDGLLIREEDEAAGEDEQESEYERDEELLEFTFPSFECFFGNNTDIMYYSPHVKVAYSPFLFHCVESLDNWKAFFTALFFGGTIPEALELLNLRGANSRNSVHVRSPILQQWDAESGSYVWKERGEEECYITCPFFPFAFHLVAKGSTPPRTWSSQLFANLYDFDDEDQIDHPNPNSRRGVALKIKSWILDAIHRNMADPKVSDDKECGGEWFSAYLRAAHRDTYDDIDNSDAAVLLQKNYMKSLSGGRLKKHNIGKIRIPSAKDAFEEILARFGNQESLSPTENVVSPRVEVLAKILIDIWVSNLFDFSLLLKIANICANETNDNVVIVCYVGSAHAKAASNFFCETLGFQRKALVGKFAWEDDEPQTLDLPPNLWNLSKLFP